MNNLKKSFFWNTLGSALNSFNSLLYMIIITRINDEDIAGIFTFTYASALLFYSIAIYSGRTYQVTEKDKNITDIDYVKNRIMSSIAMLVIAFIFCFIKGYTEDKLYIFLILCFSKAIEALSDVVHGIFQKNDRLDIVGKSLFIRNILSIIILFIIDIITENIVLSCLMILIVNIIMLIVDFTIGKKFIQENRKSESKNILKIFENGFYTFIFMFIANYLAVAPRYALDNIITDDKYQTIFGIIIMPASVVLLINSFIIQPLIMKLKLFYEEKNKRDFLQLLYKIIIINVILGFICVILGKLFGAFAFKVLYGINLSDYINGLAIILIGATLCSISSIFSNAMIVYGKTKVQMFIYIITAVFAYLISDILVKYYSINGAIYSYLSIMLVLFIGYLISFIITVRKKW